MKNKRIFILSIFLCLGMLFLSACKGKEEKPVLAEQISVTTNNVQIELGNYSTIGVEILPANTTSKDFEVAVMTDSIVTITYDKQNMQFTINAPNEITNGIDTIEIEVRTTDGSDENTHLTVTITERAAAVSAPKNVHFDGETLVWSEVSGAMGYVVNINGQDKPAVYTNKYAIDIVGEQIIAKVKALGEENGLDSAYSAEYLFKILPAPKNLVYTKNAVLQWDAVEGATGYYVNIDGRLEYVQDSQKDLTGRFDEAKTYQIKVKAIGDESQNFMDSVFGNVLSITKLNAPENVRIENEVLLWDSVLGSSQYKVYVDNLDPFVVAGPSYSLPTTLASGAHAVRVQAIGNNINYITSDKSVSVDFKKLAEISSLYIKDGVVCWSENLEATSYLLYINGMPYQTATLDATSYDFKDYASGTYTINVKAIGNGGAVLSSNLMADDFTAIKLATPTTLQVSKTQQQNILSWTSVSDASKYVVEINGEVISGNGIVETQINLPADLDVGSHSIIVRAIGDNANHISSNYSNSLIVQKLAPVQNLKVSNGQVVWGRTSNVSSYQVSISYSNGTEVVEEIINTADVSFKFSSTAEKIWQAGMYTVKVKAIGKDNTIIDGEYSDILSVEKLGIPTLRVADGKLVPASVENADKIEYTVNGEKTYDISDYVGANNAQITITAKAIAPSEGNFINGDVSEKLVCIQLPKISDAKITNGILSFGETSYANYQTGFVFDVVITDKNDTENVVTISSNAKMHDLTSMSASSYSVQITAISNKNGVSQDDEEGNVILSTIPYLTSVVSSALNFTILSAPENLTISTMADNGTSIDDFVTAINNILVDTPGSVLWDEVNGAINYALEIDGKEYDGFTTNKTNLRDIIESGSHTVRVKAVGDGSVYISSKYSDSVQIDFTKLEAPTNLEITDGVLTWDSVYNQNLTTSSLYSQDANVVLFAAIINNYIYLALDVEEINLIAPQTFVDAIKTNSFTLPKLSSDEYVISMYAIPMNIYFTDYQLNISASSSKNVISDINQVPVYLKTLETPLNLSISRDNQGNEVVSWSPLLYSNGEVSDYKIIIETNYSSTEILIPYDQANSNQWIFNQENYDEYGAGTYNFYVMAIASPNAMYKDQYYYINSAPSKSVSTIVMQNPQLAVKNGIVVWDDIDGADKYLLVIDGNEVWCTKTQFELDSSYSAGEHTFKVLAYGDGIRYINSDYSPEKTFVKLDKIKDVGTTKAVRVENGVVVYNANSIIANEANSCEYIVNINGKDYSNGKKAYHELEGFNAGGYVIYVYGSGDNSIYLKSDISDICINNPIKLNTPTNIKIVDGKLSWQAVQNTASYKIYISGRENEFEVTTMGVSYDFGELLSGDYKIRIKALGNSISYINSNWSSDKIISKLGEITNLRVENGVITWDAVASSSNNNLKLVIKGVAETEWTEISVGSNITQYVLGTNYASGTYNVYMYNNGGTSSVSSAHTATINVTKLAAPSNLRIETDQNDVTIQYIAFDSIANAGKYVLNVNNSEIELTTTSISTQSLKDLGVSLENSGTYNISVKAIGTNSPYVNSDYSSSLVITKPVAPQISAVYTDNSDSVFSGKVVWNDVEHADFYRVLIQKETANGWTEISYDTTETSLYVDTNTNYKITIVACKNVNGFDSEPSNQLELSYALFVGSGTEQDPYRISTSENFNNIKYNPNAYYMLTTNVDFEGKELEQICSEDMPFVGVIDGAGYSIVNLSITNNSTFTGLVPVLGQNGQIKNLNVRVNIQDGETVGGIVGINYGLIENCTSNGTIAPIINSVNKVLKTGGIAVENYGTISKCLNNASIAPQNSLNVTYAGGIVANNYGTVVGCGNNGSVSATMAGGIVAQNSGTINLCYNNSSAVVTGTAFRASSSVNAYAGGIVAFADKDYIISNCYNIGKVVAISAYSDVTAYAGGIVAFNNGSTVTNCYSTMGTNTTNPNISTNTPNDDGYAGILIGYNNKGQLTQNNISVYNQTSQRGAYNVSASLYTSIYVGDLDQYTIADTLGGQYIVGDNIYPTFSSEDVKY